MEIERKWCLQCKRPKMDEHAKLLESALYSSQYIEKEHIDQYYLEKGDRYETRVRLKAKSVGTGAVGNYTAEITHKINRTALSREEYNVPISKMYAQALIATAKVNVNACPISKVRHNIPLENGLVLSIDLYTHELEGLIIAEIEFESESQAVQFDFNELPKIICQKDDKLLIDALAKICGNLEYIEVTDIPSFKNSNLNQYIFDIFDQIHINDNSI